MNLTKDNSVEEVQALKILTEGYLPEIDEPTLVNYWIPRFMDPEDKSVVLEWVRSITKNVNQHAAIVRNGVRVGIVPPAVAPWPTEVPTNLRATVSEIFAEAEAAARNIPMAGTTHIVRALDAQYRKISMHPALKKARDDHAESWERLVLSYGFKLPGKEEQQTKAGPANAAEASTDLFGDEEML